MINSVDSNKNKPSSPRVSIITTTYNAAKWLRESSASVLAQNYHKIEYIIVDGGSSDATVEILNSYSAKIAHVVCEPDEGIYDAMNKGIKLASGEWLYFLGADDMFANDDILETIFALDLEHYAMVIGDVMRSESGKRYVSHYDWRLVFKNTMHHQGTFYRRTLFDRFLYDRKSKISGDYELNLKAFLENCKAKRVHQIIARCGDVGVSKQTLFVGYLEEMRLRRKYILWPISALLDLATVGRFALKRTLWPFFAKIKQVCGQRV